MAPLECMGCSSEEGVLCTMCLNTLPLVPSRCYRCQAATNNFEVCGSCRKYTKLGHVWVATVYEGLIKEVIHAYKYERVLSAHKQLSMMLVDALPLVSDMIVVSVPTATSRVRQRGYDHTLLIAKDVAFQKNLIRKRPMVRFSQSRQVGSSRKARFEQLSNSFFVTRPQDIIGKKVLIIDDVITTGATVETIAALLKSTGAKEVNALVCSQKL